MTKAATLRPIKTLGAILAALVLLFLAVASVTRGFAAVTSDGVRRIDLVHTPRILPDIALRDQEGRVFSLADYGLPSDYVTYVTLVYIRCSSLCLGSASGQAFLQSQIGKRGLQKNVRLLTISFDPYQDTPDVIKDYAHRLGADPGLWRIASVRNPDDLAPLLSTFNMVVLPDGLGGYLHNGALFMIGRDGRLARAYDVGRPDLALAEHLYGKAEGP